MKIKRIIIYLVIIIIVCVFLITLFIPNPLKKTTEEIREDILDITPVGMSIDEVLKVIEKNQWLVLQDGEWKPWNSRQNSVTSFYKNIFVNKQSIKSIIGKYRNFFSVRVGVLWNFDENLKLQNIIVEKDADTW